MKLKPIYGYGWSAFDAPGTRQTPAPFTVRVLESSEGAWTGTVETSGHEFDSRTVRFSKRHEEFDGIVNVVVELTASGWATIT